MKSLLFTLGVILGMLLCTSCEDETPQPEPEQETATLVFIKTTDNAGTEFYNTDPNYETTVANIWTWDDYPSGEASFTYVIRGDEGYMDVQVQRRDTGTIAWSPVEYIILHPNDTITHE